MSLLGRRSLPLPSGVTVKVENRILTASGPKGTLSVSVPAGIDVNVSESAVRVSPVAGREGARGIAASWGTTWAHIRNALVGVSQGFEKKLELHGVGYRAEIAGTTLRLSLGFSHPVEVEPPMGISFAVSKNVVTVSGANNVQVGDVAAGIRRLRPPEPYKGKGIRYVGEVVRRKAGKVAGTATAGT